MIVKCPNCPKYFDDQFRTTLCPHDTFMANNGQNWFSYYPQSWLANREPLTNLEYDAYQKFLNKNKVQI